MLIVYGQILVTAENNKNKQTKTNEQKHTTQTTNTEQNKSEGCERGVIQQRKGRHCITSAQHKSPA